MNGGGLIEFQLQQPLWENASKDNADNLPFYANSMWPMWLLILVYYTFSRSPLIGFSAELQWFVEILKRLFNNLCAQKYSTINKFNSIHCDKKCVNLIEYHYRHGINKIANDLAPNPQSTILSPILLASENINIEIVFVSK